MKFCEIEPPVCDFKDNYLIEHLFDKFLSLGILMCELLNGIVPFIDKPPTLIMLEKLRGSQPRLMDKTTIDETIALENANYAIYLKEC